MSLTIKHAHLENLTSRKDKQPELYAELMANWNTYSKLVKEGVDEYDYEKVAAAVNDYRQAVRTLEVANSIKPQAKLYSSILEELPVLMLSSYVESLVADLKTVEFFFGPAKCLVRMGVRMNGSYTREHKMVDNCLSFKNSDNEHICLAGLESKRYIDKVMFATVLHSFDALKTLMPRAFYGVLCEDEARADQEVESSPTYDREFLLTGKKRPERDAMLNPFLPERLKHFRQSYRNAMAIAVGSMRNATLTVGIPSPDDADDAQAQLMV